jgi:hypothetical protein
MVATLARSAGFEFTLERCEILAPQLDWLLTQSELLASLSLAAEEPVLVFRPDAQRAVNPAGREPGHG